MVVINMNDEKMKILGMIKDLEDSLIALKKETEGVDFSEEENIIDVLREKYKVTNG